MTEKTEQVLVPDIGDAEGVEVIEFCVQPGDVVALDDALLIIESDKASMEIPSTVAGTVHAFAVALGDVVATGQAIAEIVVAVGGSEAVPQSDQPIEASSADNLSAAAVLDEVPVEAPDAAPAVVASQLEVRLPDIGDAGEVVVIELGVTEGDQVTAQQMLLVVESDKASMDIVAPQDGVVSTLAVSEGDTVGEFALLAVLAVSGAGETPAAGTESPAAAESENASQAAQVAAPETAALNKAAPNKAAAEPPAATAIIYAGPAVRRMARELGVDLAGVAGSGARGRIVKDDINEYVKAALAQGGAGSSGQAIPSLPQIDFSKFGDTAIEPMSRILKRGASNLHASWLNVVHVTQHDEADVTQLEEFRKSLKPEGERRGSKITPLAFIVKACAHLLKVHPRFNASLDAGIENLIIKHYINIGFAVDTPDGLLVPVVRDADQKGVWDLADEINELAAKARDKKLTPADLQGGSFSISSLGNIGGTGFTPIVNAPEVAILGVAKLAMKPQWNGHEFVPRKMLPLSLSYDHRAINGAQAGRFVTDLAALLADMRRLML